MPSFGSVSQKRLLECHDDLQNLFFEVVKKVDCSILCGYRGEAEQMEAFNSGRSKVRFPDSKHNKTPSLAVDCVPYPIRWPEEEKDLKLSQDDLTRLYHFAGYVRGVAEQMGIKIRWGGDWNGNFEIRDEKFRDLPHFELIID
jgi:peptidoglycan L-alanyl-D-glutamate endopeptidase CwlK